MAFQSITPVKLGQAAITVATATLYTVPASTRTLVKQLDICNTTANSINVSVFLVPAAGTAGTTNAIFYTSTVAPYGNLQWTGIQVLNVNDTIQTSASATGCTITASGGEAI